MDKILCKNPNRFYIYLSSQEVLRVSSQTRRPDSGNIVVPLHLSCGISICFQLPSRRTASKTTRVVSSILLDELSTISENINLCVIPSAEAKPRPEASTRFLPPVCNYVNARARGQLISLVVLPVHVQSKAQLFQ